MNKSKLSQRVFISYSRRDIKYMETIRKFVRSIDPEINIFIDSHSIVGGDNWKNEIFLALSKCDILVVVWSWNSSMSNWVKLEIDIAKELRGQKGKPRIIPLCIDDTPLRFGLDRYQKIEFLVIENKKWKFFEYLLSIAIGGAGFLGFYYFWVLNRMKIVGIFLIIYLWIAIFLFSGLRCANAPWNRYKSKTIKILGSTVQIHKEPSVVLFILSIMNAIYGFLILWGFNQ